MDANLQSLERVPEGAQHAHTVHTKGCLARCKKFLKEIFEGNLCDLLVSCVELVLLCCRTFPVLPSALCPRLRICGFEIRHDTAAAKGLRAKI